MNLLKSIYSWLFPILVAAILLLFVNGYGLYYLSSGDVVYTLSKLFPNRWLDYVYQINDWTALISTIPVLNFLYWVLGVPFMYLAVIPFAWISDFLYNLIDILFIHPDYLTLIPNNLPSYPFQNPSEFIPSYPSDWDSWISAI